MRNPRPNAFCAAARRHRVPWLVFQFEFYLFADSRIRSGVSLTTMAPSALPINAMTVPRCRTSSRNNVIALSRLAYMVCPFSSVHSTHVAIIGFLKLAVYIGFGRGNNVMSRGPKGEKRLADVIGNAVLS